MTIPRIACLALCCLAAACSRGERAAAPASPARLLAAVAASEAAAAAAAAPASAQARKGDGLPLSGPLARLDPARLDPRLAERFLSR